MNTGAVVALEPVTVEQRHEELEVVLFSVVGRRRHQKKMAREATEKLAQSIALRVLDLVAEVAGGHLVGFVAHNEIPPAVGRTQQLLDLVVAGEHVQAGDDQVVLLEPVVRACRLALVGGVDGEGELEAALQLVLPLLGQAARAHDQTALEVAPGDQFLHE